LPQARGGGIGIVTLPGTYVLIGFPGMPVRLLANAIQWLA